MCDDTYEWLWMSLNLETKKKKEAFSHQRQLIIMQ